MLESYVPSPLINQMIGSRPSIAAAIERMIQKCMNRRHDGNEKVFGFDGTEVKENLTIRAPSWSETNYDTSPSSDSSATRHRFPEWPLSKVGTVCVFSLGGSLRKFGTCRYIRLAAVYGPRWCVQCFRYIFTLLDNDQEVNTKVLTRP